MTELDDYLANLPKPTTPESEGLPPCTPEGLTLFVKQHTKDLSPYSGGQTYQGVRWDEVVIPYEKAGCHHGQTEEALNEALDRGLLTEPVLGILAVA